MKYKITPFNLVFVLLFCYGIYFLTPSDSSGWGVLFGIAFIGLSFFILVIDYIVQYFKFSYKKIVIFQIILLVTVATINYKDIIGPVSKNFIIPPTFLGHIIIVYEVKGYPELPQPSNLWSNQQDIIVPKNGIILTSSKVSNDIPRTSLELANKTKNDSLRMNIITLDTIAIKKITYSIETYTVIKEPLYINPHLSPQEKSHLKKMIVGKISSSNNTIRESGR